MKGIGIGQFVHLCGIARRMEHYMQPTSSLHTVDASGTQTCIHLNMGHLFYHCGIDPIILVIQREPPTKLGLALPQVFVMGT